MRYVIDILKERATTIQGLLDDPKFASDGGEYHQRVRKEDSENVAILKKAISILSDGRCDLSFESIVEGFEAVSEYDNSTHVERKDGTTGSVWEIIFNYHNYLIQNKLI